MGFLHCAAAGLGAVALVRLAGTTPFAGGGDAVSTAGVAVVGRRAYLYPRLTSPSSLPDGHAGWRSDAHAVRAQGGDGNQRDGGRLIWPKRYARLPR
jgi:hypothetical protein